MSALSLFLHLRTIKLHVLSELVTCLDSHLGSAHMSLFAGLWPMSTTVTRQLCSLVNAEITFVFENKGHAQDRCFAISL